MLMLKIKTKGRVLGPETLSTKLAIAENLISWLKEAGLFRPISLSVWEGGFGHATGGKLINEQKDVTSWGPAAFKNYIETLYRGNLISPPKVLIRIEGEVYSGEEAYPGYVVINMIPKYSYVYGDIEFDIWSSTGAESLFQLYYRNEEFKEKIVNVATFGQATKNLKYIVLGSSPDADWNVMDRAFYYSPDRKLLVKDVFRTIRYLAEEGVENLKRFASLIKPYKEDFFATSFFEIKEFTNRLKSIASASDIGLDFRKSMLYITNRPESSKMFFNAFIHDFVEPLEEYLTSEETIKRLLKNIVTGQKTLDEI